MTQDEQTAHLPVVGVVGLGLMGSSIVVALLAAGHQVVALTPLPGEKSAAAMRLADLLEDAAKAGLLRKPLDQYSHALQIVEDYAGLKPCKVVMECVIEDMAAKEKVFKKVSMHVDRDTIVTSNTSAIPISRLQQLIAHPERFIGVHWAEPAYMTRFLEITCGEATSTAVADLMMQLAYAWGKEPTLLKKDIRGFITNRLMYAVYREALTLIEKEYTTIEAADKIFQYDVGSWMTLMGIFRRMDFIGLQDYAVCGSRLFKELSNRKDVPNIMKNMVDRNARGIHNAKGLYTYAETEAHEWERAFTAFNKEIYKLANRYTEKLDAINHNKTE